MKINGSHLPQALAKSSTRIFLVSGDDPLLTQEALDTLRHHAHSLGYTMRDVHHVDHQTDWNSLASACQHSSLFAEKKIIELTFAQATLTPAATAALKVIFENLTDDCFIIGSMPKIDANTQRSKGFKLWEKHGDTVPIWPINNHDMPQWIRTQLKNRGIEADHACIEFLYQQCSGNLLAAKQEIEKIALVHHQGKLSLETLREQMGRHNRYDLFDLTDAMLEGKLNTCLATFHGLIAQRQEYPLVLWAISRELRTLHAIQHGITQSKQTQQLFKTHRVFSHKQRLFNIALKRLNLARIQHCLLKAQTLDLSIKGIRKANLNHAFERWLITCCRSE